ncbi:MAG: D-TA family PLP-dependent enzyme [Bacteroidetes bacterium]|nr:D-TA family PLP-dependent enzyme [Bacteroidota bacterium]
MFVDELSTPCLLVEQSRLERNLTCMQKVADANGVALRPHAKTHKSIAIARRQREHGARGLTVAKVGEAEVFVGARFDDVRLAYPVVGQDKHERLLRLMDRARVSFCVDTVDGARAASSFYAAHDMTVDVLLEVDTGHGRCGVGWNGGRSVRTAQQIAALPGLRLVGILTHAGHAYHGPQKDETPEAALARVAAEERDRMLAFAVRLHEAGLADPETFEISIGSTPTMAAFENAERGGFRITEIRPGNYVYYDAMQVSLGAATLDDCALTVEATVVSQHRDRSGQDRLYLDAGKKVLTADTGALTEGYGIILYNPADMVPHPHARLTGLSEEHGWVTVPGGATFGVGDRVRIVPNHACVTVHTQDRFYLVDDGEVMDEHPVDARGRSV